MSDRTGNWRERAPRGVIDPNGPDGKPCPTPTDRRWLWRLETELVVLGTTDALREIGRDLRQYLNETCEHWFGEDWPGDDVIPAHRQCRWCNDVVWLDGREVST